MHCSVSCPSYLVYIMILIDVMVGTVSHNNCAFP